MADFTIAKAAVSASENEAEGVFQNKRARKNRGGRLLYKTIVAEIHRVLKISTICRAKN
jgi:hypothetical protein